MIPIDYEQGKKIIGVCTCECGGVGRSMNHKQLPLFEVALYSLKPKMGERKMGGEIGKDPKRRYVYIECPNCQKCRWVTLATIYDKRLSHRLCLKCAMALRGQKTRAENHPSWKGGQYKNPSGYIIIHLSPDDFFYPMADRWGHVPEHRLAMAKHLGRCLHSWEIVHHKNGIKDDNRLSNLKLTTRGSHHIEHGKGYRDGYRQGYQDRQSEAMKELKQQIKLLQWQIKELTGDNRFV